MLDVKQAVAMAKQQILDLFIEEKLINVGLEEIEYDAESNAWDVTIGFSRPWDEPRNALAALGSSTFPRRSYKIVKISSGKGEVLGIMNREIKS